MEEIWKDLDGYVGIYQVSNYGFFRNHADLMWSFVNSKGKTIIRKKKTRILKASITKNGYRMVSLSNGIGVKKYFNAHRLIAKQFIPNTDNKPFVNHINGIKSDNRIENLEWCTRSENEKHAYRIGLKKSYFIGKRGKKHHAARPIVQLDADGNIIEEFECAADANRKRGYLEEGIRMVCVGKLNTSCGFKWRYKDETDRPGKSTQTQIEIPK